MSSRHEIPVIGLIGGVGSGKSTVARWLGSQRRVVIIDGDRIGHQVLKEPHIKEQVQTRFGDAAFDRQGNIDRRRLGEMVFGNSSEQQQARADLERIVHPEIRRQLVRQIADARSDANTEAILLDAAVLLEAGWNDLCSAIVFVDVPGEQRLHRVKEHRGWSAEQFRDREQSQQSLEIKRSFANAVVDNSGSIERAGAQLSQILDKYLERHRRSGQERG